MTDLCSFGRLTTPARSGGHHQRRIEIAVAPFHPPAQGRAGGSTGHADPSDRVAASQFVARGDADSGLVETGADQSLAVVYQHEADLEMQIRPAA